MKILIFETNYSPFSTLIQQNTKTGTLITYSILNPFPFCLFHSISPVETFTLITHMIVGGLVVIEVGVDVLDTLTFDRFVDVPSRR